MENPKPEKLAWWNRGPWLDIELISCLLCIVAVVFYIGYWILRGIGAAWPFISRWSGIT